MAPRGRARRRNYLLEFRAIGSSVKVSAIDPVSLVEVCIVGSTKVSEAELSRLAVRKLKYVLRKQAEPPDSGPGIKV